MIHQLNQLEIRSGFGEGLLELGKKNSKVLALCADLTKALKMDEFAKLYPDRFIQCGVAEANMIGMAAGLTIGGYIPFTGTYAVFSTGRVYDQIRQSIAYSNKNVKICSSHAGLCGPEGATHQMLEDIGLMRMIPGMTIICPCDYNQAKSATVAMASYLGPVYLRLGKLPWPVFTRDDEKFEIGKAQLIYDGNDVSIFATGQMVWKAIIAREELAKQGINAEIINIHTIKPIDISTILESVKKTRCAVSVEEHQVYGGLGDSIAQILCTYLPTSLEIVAVMDTFGESGTQEELFSKYGIDSADITKAVHKVINRKQTNNDSLIKL